MKDGGTEYDLLVYEDHYYWVHVELVLPLRTQNSSYSETTFGSPCGISHDPNLRYGCLVLKFRTWNHLRSGS